MAKKSRFEYVQGKLKYVRVVKPDTEFNCWSATVYPVPDDLEKIREWQGQGMKNTIKKDENGEGWFVKFRCDVSKRRKDGTTWTFEAPVVIDKDGRPMDGTIIGNGSDGTLKLEVYTHPTPGGGSAIAARLVGVRVDNLVEYNPDKDMTDREATQVAGLRDQPSLF